MTNTKIAVVMGSDSDLPTMREAEKALAALGLKCELKILSAHRTPDAVAAFAKGAQGLGYGVIIAGAGGAAHLPGMIAAYTALPVIGVPVPLGHLNGEDALLSIVQMPKGVPVATVAIGNAWNAGVLAAQMLSLADPNLLARVCAYKDEMARTVTEKSRSIESDANSL